VRDSRPRRLHIGPREVLSFEQKRLSFGFRQRIGEAISEIQFRGVAALVIAIMTIVLVVILMIPVAFMHLPALTVVIIVRVVPICPFIGSTLPAPGYPTIVMPMRGPVSLDPGVARTWTRPTLLVAVRRWCASDVYANLSRSRDGENSCEQYAMYPIQFHFVSPI
jgi:hypothetical protein